MTIGVLKELPPETRVSILPEHITILKKWNVDVIVENDAGSTAFANNEKYAEAGATLMQRDEVLKSADIILSINEPSPTEIGQLGSKVILGIYQPLFNVELIKDFAAKTVTVQHRYDPTNYQGAKHGCTEQPGKYRGLQGSTARCNLFPRYFPMFMTAAVVSLRQRC